MGEVIGVAFCDCAAPKRQTSRARRGTLRQGANFAELPNTTADAPDAVESRMTSRMAEGHLSPSL